jgi:iron-sulfur cluster assembly protein
MSVSLTARAFRQLSALATRSKKHIVFGCTSGGCAGFEYTWELVDRPHEATIVLAPPYTLSVCPKSELYVLGTKIDYNDQGFDQGFAFQNPAAAQACGCSLSFHPVSSHEPR